MLRSIHATRYSFTVSSPSDESGLRAWFLEYDWEAWNRQVERDARTGRLDALADKALRDHAAGKTTPR